MEKLSTKIVKERELIAQTMIEKCQHEPLFGLKFNKLTFREHFCLWHYFGLAGYCIEIQKIASHFEVDKSKIRQTIIKAITKLNKEEDYENAGLCN